MFKLVPYEARTVGKWTVSILLESSSVFFDIQSVFQNLPYVGDKSGGNKISPGQIKVEEFWTGSNVSTLSFHFFIFIDSSFSIIHKVGNIGTFALLKFENKLDRKVSHFNFNSKYHNKCKLVLKLIHFPTSSNLFPLENVQKCNIANFVHWFSK